MTQPQSYSISPEAKALELKESPIVPGLEFPIIGKGPYHTTAGSSFDFELNVFDTASKLPIRAVPIESGMVKGFTDRVGRFVMHLPRGANTVIVSGSGYLEKGDFAPEAVKFEPIYLEVDLDSDATYTIYSTGEVVPGERKVLDNPGHGSRGHNPTEVEIFIKDNWIAIGLAGIGLGVAYYVGKAEHPTRKKASFEAMQGARFPSL